MVFGVGEALVLSEELLDDFGVFFAERAVFFFLGEG